MPSRVAKLKEGDAIGPLCDVIFPDTNNGKSGDASSITVLRTSVWASVSLCDVFALSLCLNSADRLIMRWLARL